MTSITTSTMPCPTKPLTLIVATTATLGIGRAGTLPWPALKQEMAYFARVTKRSTLHSSASNTINAVIMGRKTWDSLPPKFRPLKNRVNVVISRSMGAGTERGEEGPFVAGTLDAALKMLERGGAAGLRKEIGDVFVIGGSSVYGLALAHPWTKRVLVTKILEPEFECDTFFPVDLDGEEAGGLGWRRKGEEDLVAFVGEEALGAKDGDVSLKRTEGDVKWEYCLYEREGSG